MVALSDFGLASIIAAGGEQSASREALTPAYSSPEVFRAEEPAAAADVYSLAATLHALLTGVPPRFTAGSRPPSLATILAMHDQPGADTRVPVQMMALLRASLASDPSQRTPAERRRVPGRARPAG